MKKALFPVLLLTCAMGVHAEIYKWVDEQGNVHFSDEPGDPNAEKIYVPPPSTYTPPPLPSSQTSKTKPDVMDETYDSMAISSPGNEAVLWDQGGEVTVSVDLQPALKTEMGHRLVFSLDGQNIGETTESSYRITGIERGAHSITARLVNAAGTTLDSDSVTIYMRQRSVLDQPQTPDESGGEPSSDTQRTVPRAPQMPKAPQAPKLPPQYPKVPPQ